MTHTPGPWVANGRHIVTANSTIANQIIIASASPFDPRSEHEANARLIAAAPDMLAALQTLVGAADDDFAPQDYQEGLNQARAAIAKATTTQS